jgi:hypothetical protein
MITGKITDNEIRGAFGDTHSSYNIKEKRDLLIKGVFDRLGGYASGHTLSGIMVNMKLISNKSGRILKRGRLFLHSSLKEKIK